MAQENNNNNNSLTDIRDHLRPVLLSENHGIQQLVSRRESLIKYLAFLAPIPVLKSTWNLYVEELADLNNTLIDRLINSNSINIFVDIATEIPEDNFNVNDIISSSSSSSSISSINSNNNNNRCTAPTPIESQKIHEMHKTLMESLNTFDDDQTLLTPPRSPSPDFIPETQPMTPPPQPPNLVISIKRSRDCCDDKKVVKEEEEDSIVDDDICNVCFDIIENEDDIMTCQRPCSFVQCFPCWVKSCEVGSPEDCYRPCPHCKRGYSTFWIKRYLSHYRDEIIKKNAIIKKRKPSSSSSTTTTEEWISKKQKKN